MIATTVVEAALGRKAVRIERRPHAYRTSHRIEAIDVRFEDGPELHLLLKDLRRAALTPSALAAKPAFLHDARREAAAYRLLGTAQLGTPVCYGTGEDWLLLERVGIELWQVGDVETWAASARWLARLHARFALSPARTDHLIAYDRDHLSAWIDRAERLHSEARALRAAHRRAVDILSDLPRTLVHGEFYASNVMVDGERIAPVDWEMAGVGPGVLDLAALVTGWDGAGGSQIVAAYGDIEEEQLAAAQLHLAVRWLGWSGDWLPPPEHARGWLAEARSAAERLAR